MATRQYPGRGLGWIPVRKDGVVETRATEGTDGESRKRYRFSASSEYPVERWDWYSGRTYREVLAHDDPSCVELGRFASGRANVLEEHGGKPVGVIEGAELDTDARRLNVDARFGPTQAARDAEAMVADDVVTSTSIGYIPKRAQLVEQDEEKGDLWRILLWEPLELSLVGVPADPTVGLGRGAGEHSYAPVEVVGAEEPKEKRTMPEQAMVTTEAPPVDAAKLERERIAQIHEVVASSRGLVGNALDDKVGEWVRSGAPVDTVMRAVIEHVRSKGVATAPTDPLAEMPEKDLRRFSYARAILRAADGAAMDGVEGEVQAELQRRWPEGVQRRARSVLLPTTRLNRTLDSKTVGKGSEVVFEQPGEFIELLRPSAYVIKLGARLLTGLSGPISFPRQIGAMSVWWVPENGGTNVSASDPALGLALLSPKSLQGTTAYSRQFLAQANIDVESWVRNELATVHGLALDKSAIHGLGANGEPVGIYKQSGVNSIDFQSAAATYGKLVDMVTAVMNQNALVGNLAYLWTPTEAGKMKQTLDFSASAAGRPIWTGRFDDGEIGGYKAVATNQCSATMSGSEATGGTSQAGIFGNWSDLIIGLYAAMEIIVDPYSAKKQALIEVTSFQMADVLLRHPESFTKALNAA